MIDKFLTADFISRVGLGVAMALIFLYFFIGQYSRLVTMLMDELRQIKLNSGKTILSKDQTIKIFRAILNEHIRQKIKYVQAELIANDIKNRSKQIKMGINQEFSRITQQEAQFLSTLNTPAGDIGEVLLSVLNDQEQWQSFMQSIYTIIFGEGDISNKLKDCGNVMNEIVNNLVAIIEKKI